VCGDGVCTGTETCSSCEGDCGACCAQGTGPVCTGLPAVAPSGGSCYANEACNPVTNGGCQAGYACDEDGFGGFDCFAPPNTVPLCGSCAIDYCQPGMTCTGNKCARFCCTDADCGCPGTCQPDGFGGNVCVKD
jgi:hypothetical protein